MKNLAWLAVLLPQYVVRDYGHRSPEAMYFARALDFLDGRDED